MTVFDSALNCLIIYCWISWRNSYLIYKVKPHHCFISLIPIASFGICAFLCWSSCEYINQNNYSLLYFSSISNSKNLPLSTNDYLSRPFYSKHCFPINFQVWFYFYIFYLFIWVYSILINMPWSKMKNFQQLHHKISTYIQTVMILNALYLCIFETPFSSPTGNFLCCT